MIKESTHSGKQAGLFRIKFGSILTKIGSVYRKQMLRMVSKATAGEMTVEQGLTGLQLTGDVGRVTNR